MPERFFHRHRRLTLIGAVVILCLGSLLAFEALLAWLSPDPGYASHRAVRLREHKPGLDLTVEMPDSMLRDPDSLAAGRVRLRVDEDGHIRPSRIHDAPDRTVCFLGGSTTECLWVQEENRFPYVVGRLLERQSRLSDGRPNRFARVNTINAGHAGNHSMHSAAALLGKVIPLRPDVCVLMHSCNDLMVLLMHDTYWSTRIRSRDMIQVRRREHTVMSRAKDLVFQVFPHVWRALSPRDGADEMAAVRGRDVTVDRRFIEEHFRSSLVTFIELCRAWDIRPVLMTQASRITMPMDPEFDHLPARLARDFGVDYEEFHGLYHWMNELVRRVGAENDVLVIDLAREIPQSAEFVYDPYHLNDAGSLRAAELIAEEIGAIL